jgi:subtilisin family serine protease
MSLIMSDEKITPEVEVAFAKRPKDGVAVIIAVESGKAVQVRESAKKIAGAKSKQRSKKKGRDPFRSTDYYVFGVFLTLRVLRLFVKENDDDIVKVWVDKEVRPLAETAEKTVKAAAVRNLFEVEGDGVTWAVLDTGINFNHVWLEDLEAEFGGNFSSDADKRDRNGHGTHVAGIIISMAPLTKLANYKVLNAEGSGSDSQIIEAMWHIRKTNTDARKLLIHGANISLGGAVPVGSYGVGASPICQEANRLMRSGVVVCVAAGNSGHQTLLVPDGNQVGFLDSFMDLSIEDPGNAEDVITVGSVHTKNPHTYGVSFFSSKGPTGDGRVKPDVVAPGEKIWSADYEDPDGIVPMSGTSMATPVVCGVIALLLSRHTEFIGESLRVKQLVMETATGLGRNRCFEGAGMVDALRLMQAI